MNENINDYFTGKVKIKLVDGGYNNCNGCVFNLAGTGCVYILETDLFENNKFDCKIDKIWNVDES